MGVLATRSELWIGVARAFVEYQQKVPSPHDVITLNNDGGTLEYILYMFLFLVIPIVKFLLTQIFALCFLLISTILLLGQFSIGLQAGLSAAGKQSLLLLTRLTAPKTECILH